MHPHLDRVDNAGCAEIVAAFEECHAKGFLWKSMGMCNSLKESLTACLKEQRALRQTDNRTATDEKKQRIRQLFKEIDENK